MRANRPRMHKGAAWRGVMAAAGAYGLACVLALAAGSIGADAEQAVSEAPAQQPASDQQSAAADAFAGDDTCLICHDTQGESIGRTMHARVRNPRTPAATGMMCETCHGPGALHSETQDLTAIRRFTVMAPRDVSETCASCHKREDHLQWSGSMHDTRNLSCVSCHSVHSPMSADAQLRKATISDTCAGCHLDKLAKLRRSAHMPVREGKMECTSCHSPHGSPNVRMLRTGNTVNETCTSCHAEKRGPFLFDHPPVQESCVTCHDPHGSSNDRMLAVRMPMLCQRCHIATRHPSTLYDSAQFTGQSQRVVNRACVNCHSNIHGSNHPSGSMFVR